MAEESPRENEDLSHIKLPASFIELSHQLLDAGAAWRQAQGLEISDNQALSKRPKPRGKRSRGG